MIMRLAACLSAETPFQMAWKRSGHILNGHPIGQSVLIDKIISENHPHSDDEFIYTVNIMECRDCGLYYQDAGLESR